MLPRFSLRVALLLLTGGALFALVLRAAVAEAAWAFGVVVGVASIGVALAVYAFFYGLTRLFTPPAASGQPVTKPGPEQAGSKA